jgi:hypothetical protein
MSILDTGRVWLEHKALEYLLFTVWAEGEISSSDISLVREYLSKFDGKVSVLVVRESHYSFSPEAWVMMMQEAATFVNAVAYVDRSYTDKLNSDYARSTYLRNIPFVQSFPSQREAADWIKQFGPLPKKEQDQPEGL